MKIVVILPPYEVQVESILNRLQNTTSELIPADIEIDIQMLLSKWKSLHLVNPRRQYMLSLENQECQLKHLDRDTRVSYVNDQNVKLLYLRGVMMLEC